MELLEKPITGDLVEDRLQELAQRYARAGGPIIQVLNLIGGQTDDLIKQLPEGFSDNLVAGTEQALRLAMKAAERSRGVIGDQPGWLTQAVSTAAGAAGGFGGLGSALAELPVTTTIFLHGIQSVAVEHGFDASETGVQFDCVQVFAASGPLEHDDGADLAFLTTRMVLTGPAMQALIARVAPRLAAVLGQKLAAQAVPLLGAAAGAATNYAYSSYYREMAHVHFGLRRLGIEADRDMDVLVKSLRQRLPSG
ncbi:STAPHYLOLYTIC protease PREPROENZYME LASA [Candidatus Rhodobacter oscarellae]|uniref:STAPHYLOLYTIC protease PREPROENZYME LASA n=1 Tax=Candidatus Rhodobacter oscarellae TaxID=1675527 RepID=A0A0J9E761_9RHOB|nr:EcsC family protein [Candidatus Rhodobacter lobularis]KMW58547.1 STAPHYLOLYTIC protease PREPROENZYME LASA [Candidatus Rhodobacter lobularis]